MADTCQLSVFFNGISSEINGSISMYNSSGPIPSFQY